MTSRRIINHFGSIRRDEALFLAALTVKESKLSGVHDDNEEEDESENENENEDENEDEASQRQNIFSMGIFVQFVELQNVISSSLQLFTKSDFLKEFQSQQVNYKKLYKLHSDTIIFGAINFVVTLHVSGTFKKKVADYLGSYVNDRSCLRFVVARVPRRKSQ
ncbi:hypothetical protein V1477_014703 [Vespula maculifrons]|uniref:Uncharacterized protein n=1 Tax=Vespula maculifrons TaxID=7453 RepID=A0ABD2BI66_VESMC